MVEKDREQRNQTGNFYYQLLVEQRINIENKRSDFKPFSAAAHPSEHPLVLVRQLIVGADDQVPMLYNFFSLTLTARQNKLESFQ
jgi:hypothetical protein